MVPHPGDSRHSGSTSGPYIDFDVEIGPGLGRDYPLLIRAGSQEKHETLKFPFDQLALESRLDKLQIALLRSGGTHRRALSPEEQAVQEFGRALFDALLTGETRSLYDTCQRDAVKEGKALRLKLNIQPPELAVLPWEFLYDRRQAEFLCLSLNTPIVRFVGPKLFDPLPLTPPLRILGMIASPSDQAALNVADEKRRIEKGIEQLRARGLVELHWLAGQTWRDLQKAMRGGPWHVFHFIGHGGFNRSADEGFITLADEHGDSLPLYATQLARLLADHRFLRLVIVNACETAAVSVTDSLASPAAFLVRRGIPAALAMQYAISDRAAIEFAYTFYEALAENLPVDSAVAEARKAVSIALGKTVEWGTPVLYMSNPDGLLFGIQGQPAAVTPAKEAPPESQPKAPAAAPKPKRDRAVKKSAQPDSTAPAAKPAAVPKAKKPTPTKAKTPGPKKVKAPKTPVDSKASTPASPLTPGEIEIVRLVLAEKSDWEISKALKIDNLEAQLKTIKRKARVSTRRDLILWATRQGLKPGTISRASSAMDQYVRDKNAQTLAQLKQPQTAGRQLSDLLSQAAKAEARADWEGLAALANSILKRVENATRAAAHGIQPADYHFFRGLSLLKQEKYQPALLDFDTALRHKARPNHYFFRGLAYDGLKDHRQAIASFSEAIRLDPRQADYYSLRSVSYVQQEDSRQAINDLNRAIELNPNKAEYYFLRCGTYALKITNSFFPSSNDHNQALADINRALELDPKEATYYDARHALYFRQNDYQRALADINRAIELEPRNGDYYFSRWMVYKELGNPSAARPDLQRAADLGHLEAKKELSKLER